MALDSIFLCIYVVEAVLKIIALGLKYFSDSWNILGECGWCVCLCVCVCVEGATGLLEEAEDESGLAEGVGFGRTGGLGARCLDRSQ